MDHRAFFSLTEWAKKKSTSASTRQHAVFRPVGIGGCKVRTARPARGRPSHRPLRSSNRRQQTASRRAARPPPAKHKHNLIEGVALKDTQRRGERGEQEAREAQRDAAAEAQQRRHSGLFAPGGPVVKDDRRGGDQERERERGRASNHLPRPPRVSRREHTSPPCQCASSVAGAAPPPWRRLQHHVRCAPGVRTPKFWSDMGVSSLVVFLLLRWGSGGALGRWT